MSVESKLLASLPSLQKVGRKKTKTDYSSLEQIDIAWLAGLLEGEGYFCILSPHGVPTPRIVLSMTDKDVVEHVAGFFQRKVNGRPLPSGKIDYKTSVTGPDALTLMRKLLPWMHGRRSRKIREILEFFNAD